MLILNIAWAAGALGLALGVMASAAAIRPSAIQTELSAIYYVVTHGVQGTLMVSHPGGISDAEAVRVATYTWSVDHRGAKP